MTARADSKLISLIEKLTGQPATTQNASAIKRATSILNNKTGLGLSQFNELLLLHDFDRVEADFFQYLIDGSIVSKKEQALSSFDELEKGIERFRKLALLMFGNIKHGFKQLSCNSAYLRECVSSWTALPESQFHRRHQPILPVNSIEGNKTYYLGYLIEGEIKKRLEHNPNDQEAKAEEKLRQDVVGRGKRNQDAYLASDHMDVYIATSMRERHEYLSVHELVKEIFDHEHLTPLKLRVFDPTQAYCDDRIDKGLVEGLMLKRAKCTLYFVQESDTIGKDSELASTLAQGKPVIAYVPIGDETFVEKLLERMKELYPHRTEQDLIVSQLQVFDRESAWLNQEVRTWLSNPGEVDLHTLRNRLAESIRLHYDKRAETLMNQHPLGIQVCLNSGVANGVLVVRTVKDCAKIIRQVILRELDFDIVEHPNKEGFLLLREKVSGCTFRVMTNDVMLTNTFWNYYLNE